MMARLKIKQGDVWRYAGFGPKGERGADGRSLEFTWDGTQLGVRQEGDAEFIYADLEGEGIKETLRLERTTEFHINHGSAMDRILFPQDGSTGAVIPEGSELTVELELSAYAAGVAHCTPFIIYSQTTANLYPNTPLHLGLPSGVKWKHLGVFRGQGTHRSSVRLTGLTPGVPVNYEVFIAVTGYSAYTPFEFGFPWSMAASPIRHEVYVTDSSTNKLYRWSQPGSVQELISWREADGRADALRAEVTTAAGPLSVRPTQDGTKLAVLCTTARVIEIRDSMTLDLIETVPSGVMLPGTLISADWSPDNRYLYVNNGLASVRKLDSQNSWAPVWTVTDVKSSVSELRVSPDGTKIAWMSHLREAVVQSATDGSYVGYRDFTNVGEAPLNNVVAWESNSRYLWVPGRARVIHRLDTQSVLPTVIANTSIGLNGRVRDLCIDRHDGTVGVLMWGGTNRVAFMFAGAARPDRIGKMWERSSSWPPVEPIKMVVSGGPSDYVVSTGSGLRTLQGAELAMRPENIFWGDRAVLQFVGVEK